MNRKMLLILWLLLVLAVTAMAQVTKVCSDRPSTTYIYVNGIWNTLDEANQNLDKLSREFRFATSSTLSSPSLDDCVKFRLVYNKSQGKLKDMIQVIGQIGEDKATRYAQSLEGLNKENENVISGVVLSLWRTVNSIGNELLAYASTSAVNYTQVQNDLNDLITAIKEELGAGNKVVLVGHSQGNLFVNAAYDYIIKNLGAWQTQTGNRLPDNTKLAVLGISVPSDHVADKTEIASRIGRQRYTTDCVDFIWTSSPGFLPYNVRGNSTNGLLNEAACDYHLVLNAVQEVLNLLNPMSYFQKSDSQATVSLVKSANSTLISKLASIGKEWVTDKLFWGVLETGAPFRHHKLENYLTRNSPTWKQITFDLVAGLPNLPFLTVSESCLYCESFTNTNPWWKYQWENVPGDIYDGEATLQYGSLMFTTRAKAMVYQTSQQFFGKISAKVEFTHQGQGESRIVITKGMNGPKVVDLVIGGATNINATRLSIYNASGNGVVGSPVDLPISYNRKVFTAEVDSSEVRLYVDGTLQLKQGYSNTSQSTSSPSGFYVQLASNSNPGVGRNVLLVHKVEVTRLASPIFVTSSVAISPTGSHYVGQTLTGDFTIQNTSSKSVTLSKLVLGGRFNNQNPCVGVCPDFTTVNNLTLTAGGTYNYRGTKTLTTAGHYDFFVAYLPSGSATWITTVPAVPGKISNVSVEVASALTLTATCSASPAIITAGQKTVFTGSSAGGTSAKTGVWGGVVSGNGTTATYIPPASAPAGFGKATYKVTDSGSPKQTVTANCQVQINASVVVPATISFNETFDNRYSSRWTYTAASGNPSVTWSVGDLKIRAPRSGSSARFNSVQTLTGNVDASFTFNHQGYGRTSVSLVSASSGQPLVGADLDTNDTAYLNFSSGSQSTQYKYNSASYMNRKLVIRIAISGSQVRFYANGTLMETMPFSGTGPYRLMFAVGSVPWKSGDNITDFYGVTAQTGTVTQPSTTLVLSSVSVSPNPPTTGVVRITANGTGITSATAMELTGPYCSPCVLSVKVSQTATALVMDAQLNNPGTFTVKLRDGSQLTVGKDFTVTVASGPAELYQSPLFSDSTLLAYYRFEGNSTDSKSGHNGTNTGVAYGTSYGKFGQGASFTNGRINTGSWNIPTSYTISSWVNLSSLADAQSIFSNYNGEGTGPNVVQLFASTGDGSVVYSNFVVDSGPSTTRLTANTWHHVAVTHSGSTVKIYINGILDHQSNVTHVSSTRTNNIGKRGDGYQPLNGRLDDLAIFGRELTATEISSLYSGGGGTTITPPPTTGTISISTTNNLSVGCTLNNANITAPTTLSSKPTGSYSLACTAPSGYTISGITPSPTQTLSAGATVSYQVALKTTTVVPPPLSNVSCSVSSTSVQTGAQVTYTANWSGGSGSPGFNWSGHVSGTTRSVSKSFNSAGTYSASVLVMDNGQQLTGQCSNVTVTAPAPPPPPPPSLSVSWFWFSPDSPKTTDTITLNFTGTGFNSSTQVWVFGLNCSSGCQAGVVASSVTSTSMKALAQLRNVDNFQIKLRNGSFGNFVTAGTLPVR